jgi:hypothetical protein
MMPTITPADALIRTADYLTDAIAGLIPAPTATQDAVNQLVVIFKQQARAANAAATAQRVLRERAQTQRVINQKHQATTAQEPAQAQVTEHPTFKIEEPNDTTIPPQGIPQITQDEYDSPPSANTDQQQQETRTLMQEFMLQCMEIPQYKAPFIARQATSRQYPLQFLCNLAYSVLDDKTGDLLEYQHLMKHPKYKDVWTKSFGTEIRRLATATKTTFFIKKGDIP